MRLLLRMASETSNTINRYTSTIVIIGIMILWTIGIVHLFNQQIGQGAGIIITAAILLRLFVWIEKSKSRSLR